MRARTRLAIAAGATAFLTLVGSSAYAVWSSSATVSSTAKAATIGITQTVPATPDLTHTYSATSLVAATPVTLANTGNRNATYALTLLATSSATGFPAAVAVKIAPVAATTDCTRTAALDSPTVGVLSTTTALRATGTFAGNGSVILCVQTAMTTANVTTFAEKSMTVAISGMTTLGTSGLSAWTTSTTATIVTQDVASAQLYVTDKSGRYNIFNAGTCIEAYTAPWLIETDSGSCTSDRGQWRIARDATSGNYYVTLSQVGSSVRNNWAYVATSDLSVLPPTTAATQRWAIESRADATYRFRNESSGLCAYVSGTGADGGTTSKRLVKTTTCNDSSAAQGFTFELLGTPIPPTPQATTCTGNNSNYISYSWPNNPDYQSEIVYKVYIGGVFVTDYANGYHTAVNLYTDQTPVVPMTTIGAGTKVIEIKQSIAGSAYTTSALGSIYIGLNPNILKCAP